MCSPVCTLIDHGKLANQIARLVAIVVKKRFEEKKSLQDAKLKFSQLSRKYSKPNPAKFVSCLFGFVEAKKFRDSSEYSDCTQNAWAKSCLPCHILYINQKKNVCRARKGLGLGLALQCYAGTQDLEVAVFPEGRVENYKRRQR